MMKDILKLRGDRIVLFLFVLTGVIAPGIGWLFTFEHASFEALDVSRLLILGGGSRFRRSLSTSDLSVLFRC